MPNEKYSGQSAARTHEHGMDERRDLRHTVKRSGPTGGWKAMQGRGEWSGGISWAGFRFLGFFGRVVGGILWR